jgi:DNA ligase (NAD+)
MESEYNVEEKLLLMKELVSKLNKAAKAYYQEDTEIMSNLEYDALYDQLQALEQETGLILNNSPTVRVGYELLSELEREVHQSPMLSLDKTKEVDTLAEWLKDKEGLLSWKMDGLTIVLTYEGGYLTKAVTRGNGEVGEVVTNNARTFVNIPHRIPYEGTLVLRGEAVITYSEFERINSEITDVESQYKNPRNLCSGSVRQLNNQVTAERHVHFFAFSLVQADGVDFHNSREFQYQWMESQGFQVVDYKKVTRETVADVVPWFSEQIQHNDFPSDGLVLIYDNIEYGHSLGRTAKFPRDAIAFKWADETAVTKLSYIEWSPSRTGLINPVAVFEPVELEGTTVSRASLHNISIVEGLELGIGDEITVYKANMIIPQIADNLTRSGNVPISEKCPACGCETEIRENNDVKALYCTNPFCSAKKIKLFSHFVSRNAMNIDGISEASLEKMIEQGFLNELVDLYHLSDYQETIVAMEGFGQKSYDNMMSSIDKSRNTTLPRLLYGLGILNIGVSNAKVICNHFQYDLEQLRQATVDDYVNIEGIGEVIGQSIVDYFANEHNRTQLNLLLQELTIEKPEMPAEGEQVLAGNVFVITGSVEHFANRNELKAFIEELGGKVTGSVTSKTNYLINNDTTSGSSKNKKAKELGIPILSEEDFLKLAGK